MTPEVQFARRPPRQPLSHRSLNHIAVKILLLLHLATMAKQHTTPYPFQFEDVVSINQQVEAGRATEAHVSLPNVRGRIPSIQASRLRSMMLEAHRDPTKILAHACSMDGLTSRLVEEAGFPMVFLAGYPCASSYG